MRANLEDQKQLALAVLDYYTKVFKPTIEQPKASFTSETLDQTWDGPRYVTETDRIGFEDLSHASKAAFGDDIYPVSEEGTGTFQTEEAFQQLAAMKMFCDRDTVAIIDPTDGNSAFVKHVKAVLAGDTPDKYPYVGVMTSLVEQGEVTAACILADDGTKPRLAMAVKGAGAYFIDVETHELQRISFPETKDGVNMMTTVGAWNQECQDNIKAGIANGDMVQYPVEPKSAAHEWMAVLDGRCNTVAFRKNGPQDQWAGALILQEAGGVVETLNGFQPVDVPFCDGVLGAVNQSLFDQSKKIILGNNPAYVNSWGPSETAKGFVTTNSENKARLNQRVRELRM